MPNPTSPPLPTFRHGFSDPEQAILRSPTGIDAGAVELIAEAKGEPEWMREHRRAAFRNFQQLPAPRFGPDLSTLNLATVTPFIRTQDGPARSWEDVPETVRNTFERIGVPEQERRFLAGVTAQYESEAIYHQVRGSWEGSGVIFLDSDTALREHPDLVRRYFGTVIPSSDHRYAALNTAFWSGGSFLYVPRGVQLDAPLHAYFRMNARAAGQFERTLIIAEEGARVHYVEGCSAPIYTEDSLHAAVVEVIVKPGAEVRYTTVQNWSGNVYNLVTKRAVVSERGTMIWVDCNLGSKVTMKYPAALLTGRQARAEVLSLSVAGAGQQQDSGAKIHLLAPETSGTISARSVVHHGGAASYRGLIRTNGAAHGARAQVRCDSLLLDGESVSLTYPTNDVRCNEATVAHEATVSRLQEAQLFALRSRGLTEQEAANVIVNGFLEPVLAELPPEYYGEIVRLLTHELTGSVG